MMLLSCSLAPWERVGVRVCGFKFVVAAAMLCLAALAPAHALQLTDDRGVSLTFAQSPQRIVSLLPSLTESICAMDQCQRLVGVDRYSTYPVSVRRLPVLGGGLDPNIEGIVALRPDVVVLATSSRASQRLESLGIKVVALEPKSHADVRRVLKKLGVLLDVPDELGADRLWRVIDSGVSAASQSLSPKARGSRVYFEVNRGPYAAGESSFIGETLTRLGARPFLDQLDRVASGTGNPPAPGARRAATVRESVSPGPRPE